jgi:hypothetical protein
MIRDKRYRNAAGTIIGYAVAGIMLGAITAGFGDDDDEAIKAKKLAWWATTQFTDAFPIIGNDATRMAEMLITGKTGYSSGTGLFSTWEKVSSAFQNAATGIHKKDFDKLLKAAATAAEAAAISKGLPVSGAKELGYGLGIGDGDGKFNFNPGAFFGRRP